MSNPTNLETLRPCGRLEAYNTALHNLSFYKNVGLTATYNRPASSESTTAIPISLESLIYHGLEAVITRHPSLSAITINEEKSYPQVLFVRLPSIDLRTCVQFIERENGLPGDGEPDEELEEILKTQHDIDFKYNDNDIGKQPFWRVIVLHEKNTTTTSKTTETKSFTLSWIYHHSLADGTSALLFHETFLTAINNLSIDPNPNPIIKSPSTPLIPPIDNLHSNPLTLPFILHAILSSLLPSIFSPRPKGLWTGNPVPPPNMTSPFPRLRHRSLTFSAATTTNLLHKSRQNNTSVTATLQTIVAQAILENIDPKKFSVLKIEGPISLRRLPEVPNAEMINAIAQYNFLHQRLEPACKSKTSNPQGSAHENKIGNKNANGDGEDDGHAHANRNSDQDPLWTQSHALKQKITSELSKSNTNNRISLLRYVPNMHAFFRARLGKPRGASATFSNIGVWKYKQDNSDSEAEATDADDARRGSRGLWKIGRVVFSQCHNFTGAPVAVSVVTGGDGNAVVWFCWCEGGVGGGDGDGDEDGFMGRVVECVRKRVVDL